MADTLFVGIEHEVEVKYTHQLLKYLFFLVDEIELKLDLRPLLLILPVYSVQKTIAMITPTGFSIISHKGNYIFYTKA